MIAWGITAAWFADGVQNAVPAMVAGSVLAAGFVNENMVRICFFSRLV